MDKILSVLLISIGFLSANWGYSQSGPSTRSESFDPKLYEQIKMLSPEQSIATMQLPEGYSLEAVLTEPTITEPVACVFDGNGRMYVLEMRTYMQDADATGEFQHISRVSMHEDTNGDGKYDKHSIYIDNLLLPRMILPLEDSIVLGITNTNDLWLYKDTDNDGVADQKSLYYKGGKRGGNMEHQPSGLIWSLDNWVYSTYNTKRYKMGLEKMITTEPTGANQGQWGLTQDNYGKPWFVKAGSEVGPLNFQYPIVYGMSNHFKGQQSKDYRTVYPICAQPDVQGGAKRLKPLAEGDAEGKVLNHFTATCGQDIYRGDRLPSDLQGDLLFAEPVGRLIRRSKVEVHDGVTTVRNAYEKNEFIRSTDPNFRPVNMVTAPDGTLYIIDMYRGIIQEGQWTRPGSYLRKVIDQYGYDKNIQHGRIYRLVHKDFNRGPKPKMIGEKSAELVKHLSHPNGWWRDTAQKILVLRGDKSIAAQLRTFANHETHLARLHALWTLEGIGSLHSNDIATAIKDKHPQVRLAAIRAAETLIKSGDSDSESLKSIISEQVTDTDPQVVMQVLLTTEHLKLENKEELKQIAKQHSDSKGVEQTITGLSGSSSVSTTLPKEFREQHKRGEQIFQQLCAACHGNDGTGIKTGNTLMAPPLAGSRSVNGHQDQFINIVLHGLKGPIEGKTYTAPMVAMKSQSDQWIADIASYIRNDLGNNAGFVSKEDVAAVRAETKTRVDQWTIEELREIVPQQLDRKQWQVSASHNDSQAKLAIDGNAESYYTSKARQAEGMWFQTELPKVVDLVAIRLDTKSSPKNYPMSYKAETSLDGKTWVTVQNTTQRGSPIIELNFESIKAKFYRITVKSGNTKRHWSIHEIHAFAK